MTVTVRITTVEGRLKHLFIIGNGKSPKLAEKEKELFSLTQDVVRAGDLQILREAATKKLVEMGYEVNGLFGKLRMTVR